MAKQKREHFFDTDAQVNSRGYRKNLKLSGEPDEQMMVDLTDSSVFFDETDDRAKQSTGGEEDKDLNGHVQIATDAEAKANTSGLGATATKAIHAGQLPTSEAESQTIDDFTGNAIEVTAEVATTTRNKYKFKLTDLFGTWLTDKINNAGGGTSIVKDFQGLRSGNNVSSTYTVPADLMDTDWDILRYELYGECPDTGSYQFNTTGTLGGELLFSTYASSFDSGSRSFSVFGEITRTSNTAASSTFTMVIEGSGGDYTEIRFIAVSSLDFTSNQDLVIDIDKTGAGDIDVFSWNVKLFKA